MSMSCIAPAITALQLAGNPYQAVGVDCLIQTARWTFSIGAGNDTTARVLAQKIAES
jgi:hypothetical protein